MEVFSRKVKYRIESAISPNEKYFALSKDESKKVEIVNLEDGKSIFLEFKDYVFGLFFNSRNELFVRSFEKVYWYDSSFEKYTIILQSNNEKRSINSPIEDAEEGPNIASKMELSPNENYLAVGYMNGKLTLFKMGKEYGSYSEYRTIETKQEFGVFEAFSQDEKIICCSDDEATFYSVETGEIVKILPKEEYGWGNRVSFGKDRILVVPRHGDFLSVLLDLNYNKICRFEHIDNMHFDSVKNIVEYERDDKRIEWDANGRLLRVQYLKDFVKTQVGSLSHVIDHLEKDEVNLHRIVRNYERVSTSKPGYKSEGPDRYSLRMYLLSAMEKSIKKDELKLIPREELRFQDIKEFQKQQEKIFTEKETDYLRKVDTLRDMITDGFFTLCDKTGMTYTPSGICFDKNGNLKFMIKMDKKRVVGLDTITDDEKKQCRICCRNVANVSYAPCGHVFSCVTCCNNNPSDKCAICRTVATSYLKIYLW